MPWPFVVGLLTWMAAVVVLPAPLAARILLLAPLVIVPRLLGLLPDRPWITRLAGWPSLLAALPLLVAFALPSGGLAAAFVVPWFAMALGAALAGIRDGLSGLPRILRPSRVPDLGIDVALGFWAVGSAFIVADRLGIQTPFGPAIVLLTATHVHFAGLGLLGLTSLLARSRPWLRASVLGLSIGIPLTALGFVVASNPINSAGALIVGISGIGVGVALLTGPAPHSAKAALWVPRLAGAALLVSMPLAIAWSLAILTGQAFLNLETMIRTHGELNATAILLVVAAYRSELQ